MQIGKIKKKHFKGNNKSSGLPTFIKRVIKYWQAIGPEDNVHNTKTLVNEKVCRKHPGPGEGQTDVMLS